MQQSDFRSELEGLALDTAWSLWTEFGASGGVRHHSKVGIDLEALILATAYLVRLDARLLEESLDWCIVNIRQTSSDRIRNLLRAADAMTQRAFDEYGATVKRALPSVSWPGGGHPYDVSPTHRSLPPDLSRPALVQLRLRALVGVSARAEVFRWLLDQPDRFVGSLEMAIKCAYGKDNVADTLALLSRAGIVEENMATTSGNQRVFRLNQSSGVAKGLMQWSIPLQRWDACFRVITSLVEFARTSTHDEAARAADIHRLLRALQSDLRWLGTYPALRQGVEAVNDDFNSWVLRAMRVWAGHPEASAVEHL